MPGAPSNLRLLAQISSWESFDYNLARDEARMAHSRSSSQSTTNNSSPISATFGDSLRHSRMPSPNSSLSSSPTPGDIMDFSPSNKKTLLEGLPELDEDPVERGVQHDRPRSAQNLESFHGNDRWSHESPRMRPASYDIYSSDRVERYDFSSDNEGHWAKRRRSGDFAWNSFATGIVSRLPSISKRARQKKRASLSPNESSYERSPSPTSSQKFLRRSSSLRRSLGRRSTERDMEQEDSQIHANIETIIEDDFREAIADQFEIPDEEEELPLPPQNELRSTTPLLPPLLENPLAIAAMRSPLQSPTVASVNGVHSVTHSPAGTPQLSAVASPVLSAKPSVASMHRFRGSMVIGSSEIPPLVMIDPNDKWAEKLGHANFKITPEPYVPEIADQSSCEMLMKDWETARSEFSKHRSRTETHFGRSSRTFQLTEEKWISIDAQWTANNELASQRAVANGVFSSPSPKQPAPVANIPSVDDPRLIQSEDIPGPMTIEEPVKQHTPPLSRKASKRAQILRIFGSFQFPSSVLNRSGTTSGIR